MKLERYWTAYKGYEGRLMEIMKRIRECIKVYEGKLLKKNRWCSLEDERIMKLHQTFEGEEDI